MIEVFNSEVQNLIEAVDHGRMSFTQLSSAYRRTLFSQRKRQRSTRSPVYRKHAVDHVRTHPHNDSDIRYGLQRLAIQGGLAVDHSFPYLNPPGACPKWDSSVSRMHTGT